MKKFDKYTEPSLSPEKKFFSIIGKIIKYPFMIAKKFEAYNVGLGDLMAVKNEPKLTGEDDQYFKKFQRQNTKLVFFFIYGPMLIGFIISSLLIYSNRQNYISYYKELTKPVVEERFTRKISAYVNRVVFFIKDQPISVKEITPFFIAFLISLIGAKFLSRNPVFARQDDILNRLIAYGAKDMNGNPWKIIWTPDAMLFISFGEDPIKLAQDSKFWATINFPPTTPKQSKKDMNKFVVQRKQELSGNMFFKL